jgi:signal transduction histidine kinase
MRNRPSFGLRFLQFYFIVGVLVLGALLFIYSRVLMRQLESETQVRSRIYARFMSRATEAAGMSSPELDIIFEEVVKKIDFPVIVADSAGNPVPGAYRNLPEKRPNQERLRQLMRRLDSEHAPIVLTTTRGDQTVVLQQIHYGLSNSARILRIYPFFQLFLLGLFLLLGVWGIFVYNRRERERIWTALAKETAHQLATPLSSFGAWVDVLKSGVGGQGSGGGGQGDALNELSQDLTRMNEILERFSRIGQEPELKTMNVGPLVEHAVSFVKRRSSRAVEFSLEAKADPQVRVDEVLFSWTLENLLRNSVDAIGKKAGRIAVVTAQVGALLEITVTDSGEGIDPKTVRDIFKPGVTTKKYGWGVGLTLAKRIIEEYHKGRLVVKESRPGKTVFSVLLPVAEQGAGEGKEQRANSKEQR